MPKQPGLFDDGSLPAEAPMTRATDPSTSEGAAAVVRPGLGKIQRAVLHAYYREGPMSARRAERLRYFKDYGFSTIRKRISELGGAGMLRACGTDTSGRAPCTVYEITDGGREALRA